MQLLRPLGGFCVRFLIVFVLLMAPWPGVAAWYGSAFRIVNQVAFPSFGSTRVVRFLDLGNLKPGDLPPGAEAPPATHVLDTLVELRSRNDPEHIGYMRTGSWQMGYRPTAFLIALVLATPIPWKRRTRALAWGFLVINLFVLARVGLTLLMGFSGESGVALIALSPWMRSCLDFVANFMVLEFEGDLVMPAVIWFVVTFRRGDWELLARILRPGDESTSGDYDGSGGVGDD